MSIDHFKNKTGRVVQMINIFMLIIRPVVILN